MRHALRTARLKKNMTQGELARLVGLKRATITNIENGVILGSVTTWDRLQAVLGIDQQVLRRLGKERK
jgi:DNA-binding XRE family transcriptional regulator